MQKDFEIIWDRRILTISQTPYSLIKLDNSPTAKFDKLLINLGAITDDKLTSVSYSLSNIGDKPLRILGIEKGCDCEEIYFQNEVILPGEYTKITALINPRGKLGFYSGKIKVFLNDPIYNEVILTYLVNIRKEIIVKPSEINFGEIVEGAEKTGYLLISPILEISNFKINSIEDTENLINFEVYPLSSFPNFPKESLYNNFTLVIKMRLKADRKMNKLKGLLRINTNIDKIIEVPYRADIIEDLIISPTVIFFNSKRHSNIVSLKTFSRKKINIEEILHPKEIDVYYNKRESSRIDLVFRYKDSVIQKENNNLGKQEIKIKTSEPKQRMILLPIFFED